MCIYLYIYLYRYRHHQPFTGAHITEEMMVLMYTRIRTPIYKMYIYIYVHTHIWTSPEWDWRPYRRGDDGTHEHPLRYGRWNRPFNCMCRICHMCVSCINPHWDMVSEINVLFLKKSQLYRVLCPVNFTASWLLRISTLSFPSAANASDTPYCV